MPFDIWHHSGGGSSQTRTHPTANRANHCQTSAAAATTPTDSIPDSSSTTGSTFAYLTNGSTFSYSNFTRASFTYTL